MKKYLQTILILNMKKWSNLFHIISSDFLNNIKAAIKQERLKVIFLILNGIC